MKNLRYSVVAVLAVATVFSCLNSVNAQPMQSAAVPDTGWHLWLDRAAQWRDDQAYLPGDPVTLSDIAARPPTGGWSALSDNGSAVVTLPTTVEQHFWGVGGLRAYKNEYFYESQDPTPKNGNYIGVSWWWKSIVVPNDFAGKTAILHIRAAKQLAEVYVNQKLVGYNLIAETAFDCDVTAALKPGQVNTIAIRITNPGGRLDWGDWGTANIGKVGFYAGHAFGGLDRGITLTAHGPVRFTDAWVLNTPEPRTVTANVILHNSLSTDQTGELTATVVDMRSGKDVAQSAKTVTVASGADDTDFVSIAAPSAKLWDVEHPNLYSMRFSFVPTSSGDGASAITDERSTTFGFRWFGPAGIGQHAILTLNGKRIRIYSAISWGFWGINGLWPTPDLAAKEVRTAKSIGLNALNFHRNIARAEALDAADRLGLLRYTEPGGGMSMFWNPYDPSGPKMPGIDVTPASSLQRYMLAKIQHMVIDARSHPSLMVYVVQNELDDTSYKHPMGEAALRLIHEEDPSRAAILKSGINSPGEMWMAPYDSHVYTADSTGFAGWWDSHSVGTPDSWTDDDYQSPTNYVYRNVNDREITDFGEMGGSGAPDNHALMLKQIAALGGKSYDLIDHQEVDDAYSRFLDKFGFRNAFPTTSDLFQQVGAKQYEYWRNVLQCARLSDATDYLTVSGWETTAVEDHGGLVDNLRNPHGDPAVIASALKPILPAIELRQTTMAPGHSVTYDLYFLNETNSPVSGKLVVKLTDPHGVISVLGSFDVPAFQPNVFSYPVRDGLVTPLLVDDGYYNITFSLGAISETRTIHVVSLPKLNVGLVGLLGGDDTSTDCAAIGVDARPYDYGTSFAAAICTASGAGASTLSDALLARVHAGMGLVIQSDQDKLTDQYAEELAKVGVFQYSGLVGKSPAPWMGSWYFVRASPLYDGLPVNTVMKGDYQVSVGSSNGVLVEGPGVTIVTGYCRDHSREIGAGDVVAHYGKGTIVFHTVPRMNTPFQQRWLANALQLVTGSGTTIK